MPVYEYRCARCTERFEELVRLASAPAPACPTCGCKDVVRLISSFATEWRSGLVNWHRLPGKW